MARNTARQNPSNRAARYSGAGPAGISEIRPTEREAARGLRATQMDDGGGIWRLIGIATVSIVAASAAAAALHKARQPRSLQQRITELLHR